MGYYYHYKEKLWKIVDNTAPPMINTSLPVAAAITRSSASTYGSVDTSDNLTSQSHIVTLENRNQADN